MAVDLGKLDVNSVPINFLDPIKGTPLENYHNAIDEEEILRTIAIFRICLPKARIRYAGGRLVRFSQKYQDLGLQAGINAMLIGNYLTTIGISVDKDIELVKNNGMKIAK